MNIPDKIPEDSVIASLRKLQRSHNQLIEAVKARELRNSPTIRIERSSSATHPHIKAGSVGTNTDSTPRWL